MTAARGERRTLAGDLARLRASRVVRAVVNVGKAAVVVAVGWAALFALDAVAPAFH